MCSSRRLLPKACVNTEVETYTHWWQAVGTAVLSEQPTQYQPLERIAKWLTPTVLVGLRSLLRPSSAKIVNLYDTRSNLDYS